MRRPGFTLIELLTAVGVIGVLAGVTITAVNPTQQLSKTGDSKRLYRTNQLQKAVFQYMVQNSDFPGDKTIPQGLANQINVCRNGRRDAGCVNIDTIIPVFITCMPYDGAETNSLYTGYRIYQTAGSPQITSVYHGTGSTNSGGGCESPPSPIAHWKMDESTIGTLRDASDNSFDATLSNVASPEGPSTDVPTVEFANPYSLQLDGSDDYASVWYNSTFDLTTGLSIAA